MKLQFSQRIAAPSPWQKLELGNCFIKVKYQSRVPRSLTISAHRDKARTAYLQKTLSFLSTIPEYILKDTGVFRIWTASESNHVCHSFQL